MVRMFNFHVYCLFFFIQLYILQDLCFLKTSREEEENTVTMCLLTSLCSFFFFFFKSNCLTCMCLLIAIALRQCGISATIDEVKHWSFRSFGRVLQSISFDVFCCMFFDLKQESDIHRYI